MTPNLHASLLNWDLENHKKSVFWRWRANDISRKLRKSPDLLKPNEVFHLDTANEVFHPSWINEKTCEII